MFGRKKQAVCAVCTQPIYRSWDIDDNGNETEYKSHAFFGDTVDKQNVDSLLDQHHKPITKEELKAAQARVRKYSPNHPSLSEKVAPKEEDNQDPMHNVINLEQFRNRKRPE
jgi:hypothetical protein